MDSDTLTISTVSYGSWLTGIFPIITKPHFEVAAVFKSTLSKCDSARSIPPFGFSCTIVLAA